MRLLACPRDVVTVSRGGGGERRLAVAIIGWDASEVGQLGGNINIKTRPDDNCKTMKRRSVRRKKPKTGAK